MLERFFGSRIGGEINSSMIAGIVRVIGSFEECAEVSQLVARSVRPHR